MAELRIRTARHTARVAAPPRRVYQLIADTTRWPQLFGPTVHTEHLGTSGTCERIRLWEQLDNDLQCVDSHRELNARRLQVRFRREATPHPAASMGGLWMVVPKPSGSLVVLDHYYRVVDDDPTATEWLASFVDETSAAKLAALREAAERGPALEPLFLTCADSLDINGNPSDVYDLLASDTSMVRVCFPETRIAYKHVTPPPMMRAHTGSYTLTRLPHAIRATAAHTVVLRHESTRDMARQVLRDLGMAALGRAKRFAEASGSLRVGATQR